ncbi:tRNA pseudouridine65 synthase [Paucibacter oligotrophus]|uniref:tRNA pseudouridine synthase C n=1 Tax=Roseateles oligotrophus TaxID=1769250 RepID=A0A840LA92_9BURK|nr:pseudouridine synthase [Roseateles oligotrophus]MBB4845494.1 tRNA pseudouridine65 synthase [Roseateles oligotrophus]
MLQIIYADEQLVAINKPAGMLVHRSGLDAQETVFALQLLRDQLGRPVWPVHRLDKGTSGLLLFALSAEMAAILSLCFEQRQTRKTYHALVRGWPAAAGRIEHPLAKDPELPSQGQVLLPSRTDWQRLARLSLPFSSDGRFPETRLALVEARPETGRRHQIRRHLKHIAHPIIGDATHGKGPLNRAVAEFLGLQRLWLHGLRLQIRHPVSGQMLDLQAPLGPEWAALQGKGLWQHDGAEAETMPAQTSQNGVGGMSSQQNNNDPSAAA